MERFTYSHFPKHLSTVFIALFTNVKNAPEIRSRIIEAATLEGAEGDAERDAVNFAFVNANLITSRLHIQTAIYQSILADAQSNLRTKTVHSEILWSLNSTNNISEALRRFGVSNESQSLLLVRVGHPTELQSVEIQMKAVVQGGLIPFNNLQNITDWQAVRKIYKVNEDPVIKAEPTNSPRQQAIINELVVSFVAMKSVAS